MLTLLTAGANPLSKNKQGATVHEITKYRQHHELAEVIGRESLLAAIALGLPDDVLLHVRLGVDPNLYNSAGLTALMVMAAQQHLEGVEELISLGADVNAEEYDGWSALSFAAHIGNEKITKLLLFSGANIDHQTRDNLTPIQQALNQGHSKLVELLELYRISVGKSNEQHMEETHSENLLSVQGNEVEPTVEPIRSKPPPKRKKIFGLF